MSEARRSSSSFRASASRLSSGRRSSSRAPKPILVPNYAVANEESHKGEDFHREEVAEACSAFAVFDGHGGGVVAAREVAVDPRRAAEVQPVKKSNESGACRVFWHLEE